MRILVTGGAGFVGSHFVRTLLAGQRSPLRPTAVTVLDKLAYSGGRASLASVEGDRRFTFVRGDVCDRGLLDEVIPGHDAIVHLAAESHVDRSIVAATPFVETNVLGTQALLDAARRHGVRRFLLVSTDEVYGSIATGSATETTSLAPSSPYAASKAAAEMLALACHRTHGLDVVVARSSNTYGPFQFPEKVIPLFITNLLDGRSVPLYGDGLNAREWLHVDDHCQGVALALARGLPGEVYNVGGGFEATNADLTARLLDACGAGWGRVEYVEDRKGHDRRYSVDWSKIAKLGYRPGVEFERGLADTVRWYVQHRRWWEPLVARAA